MYRLLVVDDEATICFALSDYFTGRGFEVDCAQHVIEAKELISSTRYNILIADLRLAGRDVEDGLDVVKFAHDLYPKTHILVLTAYGAPEVEAEARKCGANAFILKPMPLPELAQIIYGLVGNDVLVSNN